MKKYITFLCFILIATISSSINIHPKYASLTAKGPAFVVSIDTDDEYELSCSSNLLIENNSITHPADFNENKTKGWVAVTCLENGETDTCHISIVPWICNISSLKPMDIINERYSILGKTEDTLMVVHKNKLYKTGTDLDSLIYLSDFQINANDFYWAYERTPVGSFIRIEKDIYFSEDEENWELDYRTEGRGIRNSFCFTHDSLTQVTHIFTHDYSTSGQDTFPHSVYRKTITPIETSSWEKVITFPSLPQWLDDKSLFPSCRHIHTIVKDPYTNHLWIGTGDRDQHSQVFYSDDNGISWKQIGVGSQEWRVLSIWFTPLHVYWSMDTAASPQRIFRVSRSVYNEHGFWPTMSPLLSEGYLKTNKRYLIVSINSDNYYYKQGHRVGSIIYGVNTIPINEDFQVYALNDPDYDYREVVASLPNNALWAYTIAHDQYGDPVTLLSANAEGQAIDDRPRVFGIKEYIDGTYDVQELLSTNEGLNQYAQFYPFEQDGRGNMYFLRLNMQGSTPYSVVKTKLHWESQFNVNSSLLIEEKHENSNLARLKLTNYQADSIVWQTASPKDYLWYDIPQQNVSFDDVIVVARDTVENRLYRAIIYQNSLPPLPSNYVCVAPYKDFETSIKDVSMLAEEEFIVHLSNHKLQIQRNCYSQALHTINVYDYMGRKCFGDKCSFASSIKHEVDFLTHDNAIYFVEIIYDNQRYVKKYLVTR